MHDIGKQKDGEENENNIGRRHRRRRMNKFSLSEISAVDRPAQQGATMLLMKREDEAIPDDIKKQTVMTTTVEGHTHRIRLDDGEGEFTTGDTSFEDGHSHPWVMLPNGAIRIGEADGHTHGVDASMLSGGRSMEQRQQELASDDDDDSIINRRDVRKAVMLFEEFSEGSRPAISKRIQQRAKLLGATDLLPTEGALASCIEKNVSDGLLNKESRMTDETKAAAELAAMTKRAEMAEALAQMTDVQKAHYQTLSDDGKAVFISKSADARQTEIDELSKADPIVYTANDGTEIHKSDGALMLRMAKRNDSQENEIKKLTTDRVNAEYNKRAEDELSHLPGKVEVRASMLKAVDSIEDETERTEAKNLLKAANTAASRAFTSSGTAYAPNQEIAKSAEDELEDKAQEVIKADPSIPYLKAYDQVVTANPELAQRALRKEPAA